MLPNSEDTDRNFVQRTRGRCPEQGPWVSRDRLLEHTSQHGRIIENKLSIPCALMAFGLLCFLLVAHMQLGTASQIARSLHMGMDRLDLLTGFPESVWAWVNTQSEVAFVAPNVAVIGGIRISKLTEEGHMEANKVLCEYSASKFLFEVASGGLQVRPRICDSTASNGTFWLHWPLQRDVAKASAANVQSRWTGSAGFAVQMLVHNPRVSFYGISRLAVHFDASGLPIHEDVATAFDGSPAWINWRDDLKHGDAMLKAVLLLDALLLAAGVVFLAMELLQSCRYCCCCCAGCRRRCCSCCRPWPNHKTGSRLAAEGMETCRLKLLNLLIFCLWVSVVISYIYRNHLIKGLNDLRKDLPPFSPHSPRLHRATFSAELSDSRGYSVTEYELRLDAVLEQAERVTNSDGELFWYAAVLMCCACLRLFRALCVNPRLNIIIRAMRRAMHELGHVLLMALSSLLVFVLAGYVIFGGRLKGFSTGGHALESTLLFIQGFLFDNAARAMRVMGGVLGIMWVWLLSLIMVLVLLNTFLVVVSWEYAQAKADASCTTSLSQQWSIVSREISNRHGFFGEVQWSLPADKDVLVKQLGHLHRNLSQALLEEAEAAAHQGVRPAPFLNSAALAKTLRVEESEIVHSRLQPLVQRVAEEFGSGESALTVNEAMRFNRRLDANVREISRTMIGMKLHLRMAWEVEQAFREAMAEPLQWPSPPQPLLWPSPPALTDPVPHSPAPLPEMAPPETLELLAVEEVQARCHSATPSASVETQTQLPQMMALGDIADNLDWARAESCTNCPSVLMPDDNFCRKCGVARKSRSEASMSAMQQLPAPVEPSWDLRPPASDIMPPEESPPILFETAPLEAAREACIIKEATPLNDISDEEAEHNVSHPNSIPRESPLPESIPRGSPLPESIARESPLPDFVRADHAVRAGSVTGSHRSSLGSRRGSPELRRGSPDLLGSRRGSPELRRGSPDLRPRNGSADRSSNQSRQSGSWNDIDQPCREIEESSQQQFARLEMQIDKLDDELCALAPPKPEVQASLYAKAENMTDALINHLDHFKEQL